MSKNNKTLKIWPWISAGLFVIVVIFGFGGIWATFTKISGAVIAQGVIGVESKVKIVQHLDGGIVTKIFVTNGDEVKANAPLIRLDEISLRANLNIINNNLFELLARNSRLNSELTSQDEIIFSDELIKNKTPLVQKILDNKIAFFEARKNTRIGQTAMMRKKIEQLNEQIKGLNAQINSKQLQEDIVTQNIAKKESAVKSGIISQDAMDQLKSQYAELSGRIGELQSNVAQIGGTIAETELQILQIDVDLREQIQQELREVTSKIVELNEQKITYEDKLKRTLITAPVAGRVHEMSINTVGGIAVQGKPILQIIPKNDRLIIEAKIRTTDIDQVFVGQEAAVLLSAFDNRTTPILNAKITKISAAQLIDQATNMPYFSIEIEIPKNELSRLDESQELLPGMPAEAYITTLERTPLNYLLKPILVQFMRAFKEE